MTAPKWKLGTLLVLVWLLIAVWHMSQMETQDTDIAWLAKRAVGNISEVVLWTAGWAWVTHVLRGQAALDQHIVIVGAACILDELVLSIILPYVFFAQGWPWPEGLLRLSWAVLVVLTGLVQLRLATGALTRHRLLLWLTAASMALSLVAVYTWAEQNDSEGIKQLPFSPNIYPPMFVQRPALDLDAGLKALWEKDWLKSDAPGAQAGD